MLLLLLGCTAEEDTDSARTPLTGCFAGPTIEITSPASSSEVPLGETVSLTMDVVSEVDDTQTLRLLWNVYLPGEPDDENVGTNPSETWTPPRAGIWTIRAQVEDTCTDTLEMQPVQESVTIEVVE